MFRHPSYYKNLRKLARNRDSHVRPISGSADSATDQAISLTLADGCNGSVRPDPGHKPASQQADKPTSKQADKPASAQASSGSRINKRSI
jgi:hypothetical protein